MKEILKEIKGGFKETSDKKEQKDREEAFNELKEDYETLKDEITIEPLEECSGYCRIKM